jgi:hypothetical protein
MSAQGRPKPSPIPNVYDLDEVKRWLRSVHPVVGEELFAMIANRRSANGQFHSVRLEDYEGAYYGKDLSVESISILRTELGAAFSLLS